MTRENYIYASAKVRALERHLLNEADVARVIDAETPEAAFKAFNGLDYAGELLDLEAKDYRVAMQRKTARLRAVFEEIVPDADLLRLLFLERDFRNISLFFKERISGTDLSEHVETAVGLTPADQLRRYIVDDLGAQIDPETKKDIDELKKDIGESADAETVENLVDRRLHRMRHLLAARTGSEFIVTLYRYLADMGNVLLFLRSRRLGKPLAWFEKRLNDHGAIPRSTFVRAYDAADDTDVVTRLRDHFPRPIDAAVEDYLKDRGIWRIELGLNDAIIDHLRKAKLIGYGPETIVAYFHAKNHAIRNLQTIMALKFGGIAPAEIRSHLTAAY